MSDETLEQSLVRLVAERRSPKEIMQQLQKLHPKASKKQIIRIAFAQMIDRVESDLDASRELQGFAISARATDD